MRTIKFRAWDKETQEMVYAKERSGYDEVYFDFRNNCFKLMQHQENDYPREIDAIIMQYTGLKDNNGKEIYEGDILEFDPEDDEPNPPYHVKVIWEKEDAKFYCDEVIGNRYGGYMSEFKDSIVIGNIYENPELLG